MPPRRIKRWTESEISPSSEATIALLFERLFALEPEQHEDGDPRPRILIMTPDAKRAWVSFYNQHAEEHAGQLTPATDKHVGMLHRMGLSASGALRKGEGSFLIDRALQHEAAFPTPATRKQEYFLRQRGAWIDGMTKRAAITLIGELKARQAVA